jgi:hypothetical protein
MRDKWTQLGKIREKDHEEELVMSLPVGRSWYRETVPLQMAVFVQLDLLNLGWR